MNTSTKNAIYEIISLPVIEPTRQAVRSRLSKAMLLLTLALILKGRQKICRMHAIRTRPKRNAESLALLSDVKRLQKGGTCTGIVQNQTERLYIF